MKILKFKKENENIITPTKAHLTDAGYDIYSPINFTLAPNNITDRINLGVGFEIPEGYVGIITERSSQGKRGISTKGNIIDNGYTGNVHVTLVNNGDEDYKVNIGDRICQLLVMPILVCELQEVGSFNSTERGDSAHGSSGI